MTSNEMKKRTRDFCLRVVRLASRLPSNRIGDSFARQLVRSGTSVAANYRAACRSRSRAEFIAKLGVVEEEADETLFWIDLAADAKLIKHALIESLSREASEILAIITASRKTAKLRKSGTGRKSSRDSNGQIGNRQSEIGNTGDKHV